MGPLRDSDTAFLGSRSNRWPIVWRLLAAELHRKAVRLGRCLVILEIVPLLS